MPSRPNPGSRADPGSVCPSSLTRSLTAIRMEDPLAREAWRDLYRELIARNAHPGDLYVYVQVTRGAERGRNHAPLPDVHAAAKAAADNLVKRDGDVANER